MDAALQRANNPPKPPDASLDARLVSQRLKPVPF